MEMFFLLSALRRDEVVGLLFVTRPDMLDELLFYALHFEMSFRFECLFVWYFDSSVISVLIILLVF